MTYLKARTPEQNWNYAPAVSNINRNTLNNIIIDTYQLYLNVLYSRYSSAMVNTN